MNNEEEIDRIKVFRTTGNTLPNCENCNKPFVAPVSHGSSVVCRGNGTRIIRILANIPTDPINPMFTCVPCAKILKEMLNR